MNLFHLAVIVFMALFYIVFVGKSTLLYWKNGINPFALGKNKEWFSGLIEILFLAGLLYWTFEVFNVCLNLRVFLLPRVAYFVIVDNVGFKNIGMLILTLGLTLFVSSLISFGASWRVGIDKSHPGEFVTRGVFRFTRNPIFVFIDLFFLGIWMILGNLFFLLSALVVVIGIHYQILQEEKHLAGLYGESYLAYKTKVKRYF
jgi:protein-S-isoprenylcysteine O-methyltransferase Ste14